MTVYRCNPESCADEFRCTLSYDDPYVYPPHSCPWNNSKVTWEVVRDPCEGLK